MIVSWRRSAIKRLLTSGELVETLKRRRRLTALLRHEEGSGSKEGIAVEMLEPTREAFAALPLLCLASPLHGGRAVSRVCVAQAVQQPRCFMSKPLIPLGRHETIMKAKRGPATGRGEVRGLESGFRRNHESGGRDLTTSTPA